MRGIVEQPSHALGLWSLIVCAAVLLVFASLRLVEVEPRILQAAPTSKTLETGDITASKEFDSAKVALLKKLCEFDSAILEDSTIRALVLCPRPQPHWESLETERLMYHTVTVKKGAVWASDARLSESTPDPKYTAPTELTAADYDADGTLPILRKVQITALDDSNSRAQHIRMSDNSVKPEGSTTVSPSEFNLAVLSDRTCELQDEWLHIPILAAGRGYSYLIDEVTEITQATDSELHCTAVGQFSAVPCVWELIIDTDSRYMVRSAVSRQRDTPGIIATIRNEGIHWYEKGPLPTRALVALGTGTRDLPPEAAHEVSFESLIEGADESVIAEARELLGGNLADGTGVLDRRRSNTLPRRRTIGRDDPLRESTGRNAEGQTAQQSLEDTIADVADLFQRHSSFYGLPHEAIGGIGADLMNNRKVLSIIREGREDPQKISALVTAALHDDIAAYPAVYQAAKVKWTSNDLGHIAQNDPYYAKHFRYEHPVTELRRLTYHMCTCLYVLLNLNALQKEDLTQWLTLKNGNTLFSCPEMDVWLIDTYYRQNGGRSPFFLITLAQLRRSPKDIAERGTFGESTRVRVSAAGEASTIEVLKVPSTTRLDDATIQEVIRLFLAFG